MPSSEDTLIEASPCKLRNGNWGCKTQEPVQVGDTVRIVTRANKQWRAEITQIVWTDDQVCICETASEDRKGTGAAKSDAGNAQPAKKPATRSKPRSRSDAQAPNDAPPAPPRPDAAPSDELDAMADRAAEQADDHDDLMNAIDAFERETPS